MAGQFRPHCLRNLILILFRFAISIWGMSPRRQTFYGFHTYELYLFRFSSRLFSSADNQFSYWIFKIFFLETIRCFRRYITLIPNNATNKFRIMMYVNNPELSTECLLLKKIRFCLGFRRTIVWYYRSVTV